MPITSKQNSTFVDKNALDVETSQSNARSNDTRVWSEGHIKPLERVELEELEHLNPTSRDIPQRIDK